MSTSLSAQAQALLDAHVAYQLQRLQGEALTELLSTEIDALLADAENLTLDDVVTRTMIKDTARAYAVELEPSGAIPELVADIARTLSLHPIHNFTTVGDLLPDELFSEFLDKVLELRELRENLIHTAVANPVYAALASDVVMEGVRGYVQQASARARRLPGASRAARLGQAVIGNFLPALEESMDDNLRHYLRKGLQGVLNRSEQFLLEHFDEERIRELALDVWDLIKEKRLADLKQGIASSDVEDFFVIAYETWRELRTTPFYSALIESGIDCFFDKYGQTTLRELMLEMGVDREAALRDALRFAPPIIATLHEKNLLEPLLRRQLQGFYSSPAVAAILANPAPSPKAATKTVKKAAPKAAAQTGAKAAKKPAAKTAPAEQSAPRSRRPAGHPSDTQPPDSAKRK